MYIDAWMLRFQKKTYFSFERDKAEILHKFKDIIGISYTSIQE